MSGQVRFGSRSRSGAGWGLRRGWLLSRRGVLQGAALSTREEGADSLGLLVPWSRVRLIAFVLALTSQATALQEGPPVISPSSQVEIQRWVNVEAVNLRSGPGVNHSVIQVLTVNNPVRVLGKAGRWVQVERAPGEDDAIQGWIFGRFLSDNPLTQKELESLKSTLPAKNRPGGQTALWGFLSIAIFFLAIWIALVAVRSRHCPRWRRAPPSTQARGPCLVLAATLNIRGNSYRMREHQNLLRSAADKSAGPVPG